MMAILVLIAALCIPQSLAAAGFRAGVARADLDPPPGMAMSGYGSRTGVAQGVLDPVQARVLALSDGERTIALVTLDLIFPFEPPEMERIRAAVRGKGIDEVIFHASHTHSGPTYSSNRPAYEKAIERVRQAILEAAARLEPARIGTGWGVSYIGHNRRHILPDGAARMLWGNQTKLSSFPVDPTVGVIRIDRRRGSPLAVLVNYACHPVVLGPDNLDYSADYPSAMRRVIEQGLDGKPMAFFLQGAPGDINPYDDKTPRREDAAERMRRTGEKLGVEALRVARRIRTVQPARGSIAWKTVLLPVKSRWNIARLRERVNPADPRAARMLRESMELPVTALVLHEELALVTMPGEPFVEFQMQLRARSPLPETFFLGYTNGTFGYFPTIAAAVRGGYGATSATWVEVGAGERMLNAGLVALYELLGKLNPPSSPQTGR